jgi:hypothetical protein
MDDLHGGEGLAVAAELGLAVGRPEAFVEHGPSVLDPVGAEFGRSRLARTACRAIHTVILDQRPTLRACDAIGPREKPVAGGGEPIILDQGMKLPELADGLFVGS